MIEFDITDFELVKKIYESQRSVVHRGRHSKDNRLVIIKILNSEYPTPEQLARFKSEYEIARRVGSKNTPGMLGMGQYKNSLMMVMEDFGGRSLDNILLEKRVTLPDFFSVSLQLTTLLGELHQQNIVHKDINPSNIVWNLEDNKIRIIDFGISTELSRENPQIRNPSVLEGSLMYISPEQTGRMNRSMDYRTDFYSLGVVFYELLTGTLPFYSDDLMELIHYHIAKRAKPPHEVNPEIPSVLSDIVLKLLAKTAEDRYQSALGLKTDLEYCLKQLETTGAIKSFELGQKDISGRFQIPQKLYGRETEIEQLLEGFDYVCSGNTELMLVSGYSGIGKTALIQEIHKPIVQRKGYVISGKCDQFRKNIPYSAIIQAFKELIRQLFMETEEQLAAWKTVILKAVGSSGRVIIEFIPDLELVIGKQPPVQELPPAEAQHRLNLIFQAFVQVFTRKEHPLVIFLDDLQWADSATLKLIKLLVTDPDTRYLFFIGTYRSNEVDGAHPVMKTIKEIEKAGAAIRNISLKPLESGHINQLIRDTLICDEKANDLSELILRKTGGNAFFVNEFLKTLYRENALTFQPHQGCWAWSVEETEKIGITHNVVDLMSSKIKKLPKNIQHALMMAACFGNRFYVTDLAVVLDKPVKRVINDLWEAIKEELILLIGGDYKNVLLIKNSDDEGFDFAKQVEFKFLHDRVQQAAYSLLSEDKKTEVNLQIGRLLLENAQKNENELDDKIFDIVNHMNYSIELITGKDEKHQLTRLNMTAGKKAKASTAYEPALRYFTVAHELLPPDSWNTDYDFTLSLFMERAECEYLNGHFDDSEKFFEIILNNVKSDLEKVKAYNVKINVYQNLAKYRESFELAAEAFKLMGVNITVTPGRKSILLELIKIKLRLRNRKVEDLIHIPQMEAVNIQAVMETLATVGPSLVFLGREVLFYLVLIMMELTLKYGNSDYSAFVYMGYGLGLCAGLGDYGTGFEYGELALRCLETSTDKNLICKTHFIFGRSVNHWKRHVKTSLDSINIAYQSGIETGNVVYAAYAAIYVVMIGVISGTKLYDVLNEAKKHRIFIERIKYYDTMPFFIISQQMVLCLKGRTNGPGDFSDNNFDEGQYRAETLEKCKMPFALSWYSILKTQVFYIFGMYGEALEMAGETEKRLAEIQGNMAMPEHYFYYSLTLTALYPVAPSAEKKRFRKIIKKNLKKLAEWSRHCPENFQHKYLLVAAETERLFGEYEKASDLYEKAAKSARENEYIQNQAIANECAARYYLERGNEKVAEVYLNDARYCYRQWGAKAKLKQLEEQHPRLFAGSWEKTKDTNGVTIDTTPLPPPSGSLDWNTMMKASRIIAGEIMLNKLLEKMMTIVIESAGAQKGFLVLETDGKWYVQAEASVDKEDVTVMQRIPLEKCGTVAVSIVNFVARAKKSIVLSDATNKGEFTYDPYIIKNKPKSVLSFPLVHKSQLSGILYLENNLTTDAFTPDRLEVLTFLSSQVAISIENARLYLQLEKYSRTLEQKVDERTVELKDKNAQIISSIRYAKRIQQAILPLDERMKKSLGKYFVINKPKEIVSGDFFWFGHAEGKSVIAVVDCTGHGVPGAFMSMIGNMLLNQIVNEKHIMDPALILENLHEGVRTSLKQETITEVDTTDGMDVCLCLYDAAEKKITFAGSRRPLYIVKSGPQPQLIEIKGERKSIGGRQKEEKRTFTNHEIDVRTGDMIYLTSDGFVDQNDPGNARYGSPRLKEVLTSIAAYGTGDDLDEQKKMLLKELKDHQGNTEQRDDITIVGVRI
jgi:predicted ATPase/serine phosphatase RsbU (regulator of sigma subunit)/tRNA A-37 threonylcarbamoyl transferase component Bud32